MQNSYFQENPIPLHMAFLIFGFFHNLLLVKIETQKHQETIEKRRRTSFVKIIWTVYKLLKKNIPDRVARSVFPLFFGAFLILIFQINQHPFAALLGSALYEFFYYLTIIRKK